ncbi:glycosyltransferase family 2 protein [Spirosoma aerolatum]|uniref:glycosyltransferase family 2 protein n=1 Tax=Spirosoma aerolatum TaxID=1211326 RepID=UPI0009AE23B5|nr:glycosyltransferase family 2 protein [Spirosoma aerolatum]
MNRLSIITINYNNAIGLKKTIESVISQTFTDYEFIIIDGASTDGSVDIIKKYVDKITFWASEEDSGIYNAMNKGISKSNTEYCLFLNSGDWLNEDILGKVVCELTGEEIIYFNTYLSYNTVKVEQLNYPSQLTMRSFFKRTIGHQSTIIKRGLFTRNGYYKESYRIHADYEFWIRTIIIGNASCKYVNDTLSYYDMGGQSSIISDLSLQEIDLIINKYLPKRIVDDYEYWYTRERELEILLWYKRQKYIYIFLVFIYKIIKNINMFGSKLIL